MPHRPQTTEGITASRSTTYTIGRAHRGRTTSVSNRAMATLTGAAITIAITEVITVPYRKAIAPNLLAAGSQSTEKIPLKPSAENHDEACWLVENAIRTRITSTSRPEARARIWKPRSPSGRRTDRWLADPAWPAGSA